MRFLGLLSAACGLALVSACGGYVGPPPESLEQTPGGVPLASTAPSSVPTAAASTPAVPAKPTPTRPAEPDAGPACTLIGGSSTLTIGGDRAIRDTFVKVDVTLTQGSVKRTTSFPGTLSVDGRGILIDEWVYAYSFGYVMTLASDTAQGVWRNTWDPDKKATVVVVGRDGEGRPLTRTRETFTFAKSYPNGEVCDKDPYLSHTVKIAARDRV